MNARKVVEPICLDILLKWRGDEETGRDQMDEILREVVIITDSDDEDETSESEDGSEEGEIASGKSAEAPSKSVSRNQARPAIAELPLAQPQNVHNHGGTDAVSTAIANSKRARKRIRNEKRREKQIQRGFKRYQAAWDDAINRRHGPSHAGGPGHMLPSEDRASQMGAGMPQHDMASLSMHDPPLSDSAQFGYSHPTQGTQYEDRRTTGQPVSVMRSLV